MITGKLYRYIAKAAAGVAAILYFLWKHAARQRDRQTDRADAAEHEALVADQRRETSTRISEAQTEQRRENASHAKEQTDRRESGTRPDRFGDKRL